MNLILVWGLIACLLSALNSLPQTARILRTGRIDGLNPVSYLAWVLAWVGWLTYSFMIEAWPKVAAESLGLVCETLVLFLILRRGGFERKHLRQIGYLVVPLFILCLSVGIMLGLVLMAVALTLFDLVFLWPQLKTVATASSLEGISLWSYGLRATGTLVWIGYGFLIGRPESAGWGWIILPFCCYVIYRVYRERKMPLTV